jgi:predicted ester cyclase
MKFVLPLFRSNIGLVLEMRWTSLSKFLKVPSPPQAGEGFKQCITEFFEAFPDKCTTVEHIVAENNLVTVFLNGSGTHKGIFKGVPPTNTQIIIRSPDLYKIENGVITGHWEVIDQLNLLKQTGSLLSESKGEEFKDARVVWIRDYA